MIDSRTIPSLYPAPFTRIVLTGPVLVVMSLLGACGTDSDPTRALFAVPGPGEALEEGFFALPYPNDLRRTPDGHVDLPGLPRPNGLLEDYLDTITDRQVGFGLTSAIHLRFDGPIDVSSLPASPTEAQLPEASAYLVNLSRDSSSYGERLPMQFGFQQDGGELIGDNWLGALPFPGFVLEEETLYALVVTNRVLAQNGSPLRASPDFEAVLDSSMAADPTIARAQEIYEPLAAYLDEEGGDARDEVVSAAVFTTQNATELMGRFREVIYRDVPESETRDLIWIADRANYSVYTGRYDSPHFQKGNYPYKTLENGGGFVIDPDTGDPVVQGTSDLRFSMTIPYGAMPPAGWPVLLYAHGTGGDYRSHERNGTAARMAMEGIAVLSIDQVMHGDRVDGGSDVQILFFNFQNPLASRANVIQAALEDFHLLRFARSLDVAPPNLGGASIRFDDDKMYFFGHSQGSITGVPFLAHEPEIKGAILSGAGGLLYLGMLSKTKPYDITALLGLIIRDPVIDRFHPGLALCRPSTSPPMRSSTPDASCKSLPRGALPRTSSNPWASKIATHRSQRSKHWQRR